MVADDPRRLIEELINAAVRELGEVNKAQTNTEKLRLLDLAKQKIVQAEKWINK